jgi:hypothetical protein
MLGGVKYKLNLALEKIQVSIAIFLYNYFKRIFQKRKYISNVTRLNKSSYKFVNNRSILFEKEDFELKELIVTCYFSSKLDPIKQTLRNSSDFSCIEPWYNSINSLGLKGIILHDGLDKSFIDKYQNKNVSFRYCKLGQFGIFEERWFLYNYLIKTLVSLDKIFFTDSNDVYINQSPFTFAANFSDFSLFIGRDNANRIKDSGWLLEEMNKFVEETKIKIPKTFKYQWLYNAGVVGGSAKIMFFFTEKFIEKTENIKSVYHKDMTIVNLIVHEYFFPKLSLKNWNQKLTDPQKDNEAKHDYLITGFPFNSEFQAFQLNKKVCFVHK